jgi:hypothetical protein
MARFVDALEPGSEFLPLRMGEVIVNRPRRQDEVIVFDGSTVEQHHFLGSPIDANHFV